MIKQHIGKQIITTQYKKERKKNKNIVWMEKGTNISIVIKWQFYEKYILCIIFFTLILYGLSLLQVVLMITAYTHHIKAFL